PQAELDRMRSWAVADNLWLRRAAILSQLSSKEETDRQLLVDCITPNLADREFFIRKAVGWSLRQYARSGTGAADWVRCWVDELGPASRHCRAGRRSSTSGEGRRKNVGRKQRGSRPRHAADTTGFRAHRQHLIHPEAVALERERGTSHVEPPDPRPTCAAELNSLIPVGFKVRHPRSQRQGVVLPQRLDITNLEAGLLQCPNHHSQGLKLPVGEDVSVDERCPREALGRAGPP